jgi:hypothetical protein
MRRARVMAISLSILLPLGVGTASAATATTAPAPGQAQTGPVADNWYIKNYSDYLTDPYGGGNGTAVKFDYNVENRTSTWEEVITGTVTVNPAWPFTDSRIDAAYSGDTVAMLENIDTVPDYSLGAVDGAAVMRPNQDGNNIVFNGLSDSGDEGADVRIISVYMSNENDLPECLTNEGAGQQARYSQCNGPGQTLDYVNPYYN